MAFAGVASVGVNATPAFSGSVKKGGALRIATAFGSNSDSLNPATFTNDFMRSAAFMFGNCLTEIDGNGQVVGELAETCEASDDAKTWIFKLRKGVEFHSGKSLEVEDVIATFNYHRNSKSKSSVRGLLSSVRTIRNDGDHGIIFELNTGNADFPYLVSDCRLIIKPKLSADTINPGEAVGTGGYKIEKFEPGVSIAATKSSNYFKSAQANFDSVEMKVITDWRDRHNALLYGQVDHIDQVDPKLAGLFSGHPGINFLESPGKLHYSFPMRFDVSPFDNANLRLALRHSIDREGLLKAVLHGHGRIGNDHPVSDISRYYNEQLEQRVFDVNLARNLYKKSGHVGPIRLSVSNAAFPVAVEAAWYIKTSVVKAGIDVQVVHQPSAGYWTDIWNKTGWCASYWSARVTEDWMLSDAYGRASAWNETAWRDTESSKQFNQLLISARAELDDSRRREMYHECQKLIHLDSGAIIPVWQNHLHASSRNLMHAETVAGNYVNDGGRLAERWWFA